MCMQRALREHVSAMVMSSNALAAETRTLGAIEEEGTFQPPTPTPGGPTGHPSQRQPGGQPSGTGMAEPSLPISSGAGLLAFNPAAFGASHYHRAHYAGDSDKAPLIGGGGGGGGGAGSASASCALFSIGHHLPTPPAAATEAAQQQHALFVLHGEGEGEGEAQAQAQDYYVYAQSTQLLGAARLPSGQLLEVAPTMPAAVAPGVEGMPLAVHAASPHGPMQAGSPTSPSVPDPWAGPGHTTSPGQ